MPTVFGIAADGSPIHQHTLTNAAGVAVDIIDLGGVITRILAPDRRGNLADVVLGFDSLADYEKPGPYFGAIIGRYGNRIARGTFTLDGKTHRIPTNDGPHALHGGTAGFDKKRWAAEESTLDGNPSLTLTATSPDGDQGFPGNLAVRVTYTLTPLSELVIDYHAITDAATPINLTNHSYFNLAGVRPTAPVLEHVVTIHADQYVPVNASLIPTGEIGNVKGTPFDFTAPHRIGERLRAVGGDPIGYDIAYTLRGGVHETARPIAHVLEPTSGRVLDVATTEPSVQFYTGNFLDKSRIGKGGVAYEQYAGFCLETQHYPDSPNHASFPSTILRPGEAFKSQTIYRFTAE